MVRDVGIGGGRGLKGMGYIEYRESKGCVGLSTYEI